VLSRSLATSFTCSAGAGSAKDFSAVENAAAVCGKVIFREFLPARVGRAIGPLSDIREKSILPPATL
jgi:hypothetical protein